jgi:molybdate transport system permease protein
MRTINEGCAILLEDHSSSAHLGAAASHGSPKISRWASSAWRLILAFPLLFFIAFPVLMLFVSTSPAQLLASLEKEQVYLAIGVSLKTTLVSLLVILLSGTPLAYWLGRHQFRFKQVVDTLIDLPTLLPPSVAGVALLMAFGRRGILGPWFESIGIQIPFTQLAVILAQVFIASPFFVRAAIIGFAGVDPEIEQAAQLDGANRWQVIRYVILPLSREALISGGVMSWSRALGEFGATMIFAGNYPGRTQTMPTAIYLGFEVDLNIALTLSVILVTLSFSSLLLVKSLIALRTGKS